MMASLLFLLRVGSQVVHLPPPPPDHKTSQDRILESVGETDPFTWVGSVKSLGEKLVLLFATNQLCEGL